MSDILPSQEIIKWPNPLEEVKRIMQYATVLLDYPEGFEEDLKKAGLNTEPKEARKNEVIAAIASNIKDHQYKLTSVNWFTNLGINHVYHEELLKLDIYLSRWNYLKVLEMIVGYWLTKYRQMWVFNNLGRYPLNANKLMDEIKHYQEDEKDEISYKVTLGGLEELALTNTLEEVFPETIKALNDAYEMSDTSTYFLDERNIDKNGLVIPITFVIDPIYLSIIFAH
jgi:hypothetical protein|nr:MAG TPA: hypothetical protein [Caudoviricetes sp.]